MVVQDGLNSGVAKHFQAALLRTKHKTRYRELIGYSTHELSQSATRIELGFAIHKGLDDPVTKLKIARIQ